MDWGDYHFASLMSLQIHAYVYDEWHLNKQRNKRTRADVNYACFFLFGYFWKIQRGWFTWGGKRLEAELKEKCRAKARKCVRVYLVKKKVFQRSLEFTKDSSKEKLRPRVRSCRVPYGPLLPFKSQRSPNRRSLILFARGRTTRALDYSFNRSLSSSTLERKDSPPSRLNSTA